MISSKNIRFHSPSNTYIIPKNSVLDQNVAVKGNVIVGPGTRFWKNIKIDGNIQLGKGCIVEGDLKANRIIVGSRSKIKGNMTADSDVSLFQNAIVRSVESGGNITIMPGCVVGYANGSTLSVIGKAEIKKIGIITKVTVRANTVAELEDELKDGDSELEGSELNSKSEYPEFAAGDNGDKIDFNDPSALQPVSEESIFEDDTNDNINNNINENVIENESADVYNNESAAENSADSDSLSTPAFPMEHPDEIGQLDIEISKNSEDSDAEIIDENDENSPKSFTVVGFAGSSADHPVRVPDDESGEVEIVGGSDDFDSDSGAEAVQTVETPFGTIAVGERSKNRRMKTNSSTDSDNRFSSTPSAPSGYRFEPVPSTRSSQSDLSDNQFASVMESTRDEQQADFEAEMKIRPTVSASSSAPVSASRKSEFKWPAFEPKKMPKTGKIISKETAAPSDSNLFSRVAVSQIEYEEITIQTVPRQKESFSNQEQMKIGKANQKIVFEEIGRNPPPQSSSVRKSKADILMEKMNFDAVDEKPAEAKISAEKKVRSQEEIEKSKIWYEERYPQAESKKKEYQPYV